MSRKQQTLVYARYFVTAMDEQLARVRAQKATPLFQKYYRLMENVAADDEDPEESYYVWDRIVELYGGDEHTAGEDYSWWTTMPETYASRTAAKKKYIERYDRYDRASIAKWLAGVIDRSAQEQEDAQDIIDEISDSEDPKRGQAFSRLLKDHVSNQNHIMSWALKQLDDLPNLAKKSVPEAKSEAALPESTPADAAPALPPEIKD
jgi:hypothetical protein